MTINSVLLIFEKTLASGLRVARPREWNVTDIFYPLRSHLGTARDPRTHSLGSKGGNKYDCHTYIARAWINWVRLPILLMVS